MTEKQQLPTRNIAKSGEVLNWGGCSPLQLCNGLIILKPAIAYFSYTQPLAASKNIYDDTNNYHSDFYSADNTLSVCFKTVAVEMGSHCYRNKTGNAWR